MREIQDVVPSEAQKEMENTYKGPMDPRVIRSCQSISLSLKRFMLML